MPGCLLPAAMAAGLTSPAQWGLHVPQRLHTPPPPSVERVVYGTPLAFRQDTEHFSLQWETPALDSVIVAQVEADMEAAWDALVEDQEWDPPVSSEAYLLTVILDPDIGGTGLTYTVEDADYPAGVPVMYINPLWAEDPSFMSSLCAHEFAHALQFAVRDWYDMGDTESWYWEASAEWQAEVARPEMNTYAWSSQYYASAPHADHHSMGGYHQYGMCVFNAYLDEYALGAVGLRDLWLDNDGLEWHEEIGAAVGDEPGRIWAAFSAAYGSESLRESDLYTLPLTVDGTTALEGWLGTHYIQLGDIDGEVFLDGGVGAVARGGQWVVFDDVAEIPPGAGDVWLVVVNPDPEPLYYRYSLEPWEEERDSGDPPSREGSMGLARMDPSGSGKGCACATGSGSGPWLLWPLILWRRRASGR